MLWLKTLAGTGCEYEDGSPAVFIDYHCESCLLLLSFVKPIQSNLSLVVYHD